MYPYFAVSGGVSFMLFSVGDSYVEFVTVCENKFPLWDNKGYLSIYLSIYILHDDAVSIYRHQVLVFYYIYS